MLTAVEQHITFEAPNNSSDTFTIEVPEDNDSDNAEKVEEESKEADDEPKSDEATASSSNSLAASSQGKEEGDVEL